MGTKRMTVSQKADPIVRVLWKAVGQKEVKPFFTQRVGVSHQSIRCAVRGEVSPKISVLRAWAQELGYDIVLRPLPGGFNPAAQSRPGQP